MIIPLKATLRYDSTLEEEVKKIIGESNNKLDILVSFTSNEKVRTVNSTI